jgi:hypothetical protein
MIRRIIPGLTGSDPHEVLDYLRAGIPEIRGQTIRLSFLKEAHPIGLTSKKRGIKYELYVVQRATPRQEGVMESILGILIGLGLAAACGFRVFVPLLITSLAAQGGYLELAPGFEWIGSDLALGTFAVATVAEIGAFYVPWLDNLLDSLAIPAATIAGILAMASVISGMHPLLKWAIAVIGGGGAAGSVQLVSTMIRGGSTLSTGGLANPLVSTAEATGALFLTLVTIFFPILAAVGLIGFFLFASKKILKRFRYSS